MILRNIEPGTVRHIFDGRKPLELYTHVCVDRPSKKQALVLVHLTDQLHLHAASFL